MATGSGDSQPSERADMELKPGSLYRHYKGKMYRIHGTARHSETLEEVVIYECLYENALGSMWVRPKGMFMETISTEKGLERRFAPIEG